MLRSPGRGIPASRERTYCPIVNVRKALLVLGRLAGAVFVVAGILGLLLPRHTEGMSIGEEVMWFGLLVGGGALVLAGLRLVPRAPWVAAALVSVGAVAGSLPLFWTLILPLVAIALFVLSIVNARRVAATA